MAGNLFLIVRLIICFSLFPTLFYLSPCMSSIFSLSMSPIFFLSFSFSPSTSIGDMRMKFFFLFIDLYHTFYVIEFWRFFFHFSLFFAFNVNFTDSLINLFLSSISLNFVLCFISLFLSLSHLLRSYPRITF